MSLFTRPWEPEHYLMAPVIMEAATIDERCTLHPDRSYLIMNLINTLSLPSDTLTSSHPCQRHRSNDAAVARRSEASKGILEMGVRRV